MMNETNLKAVIILAFMAIICVLLFLNKFNKIIFGFFEFTDESLSKQKLFKISLTFPFFIALLLCFPIWFDNSIKLDLSPSGYEDFLSIFKLPIGVWSLSIPLVAIVAHIHRTIQTAAQLEVTRKKNLGDTFFAHHKYITEALSKFPEYTTSINKSGFTKKVSEPYKVYNKIFENSSYETGLVINDISGKFNSIQDSINNIVVHLNKAKTRKDNILGKVDDLNQIISTLNNLNRSCTVSIQESKTNYLYMVKDPKVTTKLVFVYENEEELKNDLKYSIELISSICALMNKRLEIKDILHYYINTFNERHFYFKDIFDKIILTPNPIGYGTALKISDKYDEDYQAYTESLKMKAYVAQANKH